MAQEPDGPAHFWIGDSESFDGDALGAKEATQETSSGCAEGLDVQALLADEETSSGCAGGLDVRALLADEARLAQEDFKASEDPEIEVFLLKAVQEDNFPLTLRLLWQGVNPNTVVGGTFGETPLFEAVAHDNADMMAVLLLFRADAERESRLQMRPMDLATERSTQALLRLFQDEELSAEMHDEALAALSPGVRSLLQQPEESEDSISDVDSCSEPDRTPLVRAVEIGDLELALRLLQEGADVNAKNRWGETALFEASATGDADMVALLFLHRADPSHTSGANLRAEDIAATEPLKVLLRLFRGHRLTPTAFQSAGMAMDCRIRRRVAAYLWDWGLEDMEPWPDVQLEFKRP
mmetsp:Transcript_87493/g.276466  ORF Transcript_87493/g.276466 Transcript_87493/m.276466 type:complete len:353 (-) Transcript_87493:21-1079(-)